MEDHSLILWSLAAVMAVTQLNGQVVGQCERAKLLASDGEMLDSFGGSVSVSGSVALMGAVLSAENGVNTGAAYIYRLNPGTSDWIQETKLLASDRERGDFFGWSVSITGTPGHEVAIVGANLDDDHGQSSGSVYVYRFDPDTSGWVEEAKLLASDGAELDFFGGSVSITGAPGNEVIIVGAEGGDDNGESSGSAYIYRFNPDLSAWGEEQKLLASDSGKGDRFGGSVAITGAPGHEVAIVGAWTDDNNGQSSGTAYIFRFDPVLSAWVEEQKLVASDSEEGDRFGAHVAITGAPGQEVAIVGAIGGDDHGTDSGSAYVYRFHSDISGWTEEAKLIASDGAAGDLFGFSVAIHGLSGQEVVVIGVQKDGDNGANSGSAHLARCNPITGEWELEAKLLASDGAAGDRFGRSVSISGTPGHEIALIGATWDEDNGPASGSAYIFGIGTSACCPADLNGDGIVDVHDLLQVVHALRTTGDVAEDLDGDGVVTPRDMHFVIQAFGPCEDSTDASNKPSHTGRRGRVDRGLRRSR
jgi:hypothetical protein